jgi:hypothetical protein
VGEIITGIREILFVEKDVNNMCNCIGVPILLEWEENDLKL